MLILIWMGLVARFTRQKVCSLVKTYTYILESTDKDGNTINTGHIIMQGIPTPCVKYYAKQNKMSVLDLYKKLCKALIPNLVCKF